MRLPFLSLFAMGLMGLCLACFNMPLKEAHAQTSNALPVAGIVATVNEEAITAKDLDARLRMALSASKLPNNEEVKRSLVPQILRTLVEEKLKIQEAASNNITLTPEQISNQIDTIATNNRLSREDFIEQIRKDGVSLNAVKAQVEADLVWGEFVSRRIKPDINVSESEIDAIATKLERSAGKKEYRIAEIFIRSEGLNDTTAKKTSDRIYSELRKGAPFPALARQFSQSGSAATNGDMGWIIDGSLAESQLNDTVFSLEKDTLSEPLKGQDGYHIYYIIDARVMKGVADKDILLRQFKVFTGDQETATKISRTVKGCVSMNKAIEQNPSSSTAITDNISMNGLGPNKRAFFKKLYVSELSAPINETITDESGNSQNGVAYYMICRTTHTSEGGKVSRTDLERQLLNEKLELRQKQYLQSLQSRAFIDIRL